MSTTIGGTGAGYGILGTLIANSTAVHQQLDTLTEQVSKKVSSPRLMPASAIAPAFHWI